MKNLIALLLVAGCCGCKDEGVPPPPPHMSTVQLTLEEAGVTEVWLRLRFTDTGQPRGYALLRDGAITLGGALVGVDTVLLDTTAASNRQYNYKAFRLDESTPSDSSDRLQVTTLDTTSHQGFAWSLDTLGETSSLLYDVAVINDTLAYVVGEMYLQTDPQAYNMARWNGQQWELMRIQFFTICGQPSRTPYPASAIFAFSATDVWITSRGGQLARWNGTTQTATICNADPFVINKIWGENPNSIWAVGNGGRIGHYVNATWLRIESGTTLPVQDIWGEHDLADGSAQVIAVASNKFQNMGKQLMRVTPGGATVVSDTGLPWSLSSVWFSGQRHFFVCGDGVFTSHSLTGTWQADTQHPLIYKNRIRGNGVNDIFVVGAFGLVSHFNGVSWYHYMGNELPSFAGEYDGLDIKNNLVVAAGFLNGGKAIVLRGMRQ